MKAYALYGIGDLRYEDRKTPECPPNWAIVRVKAAGICSSDIPRIFEKGTYRFPTVPGHEFSGIVDSVADTRDERWIGKRVGVFPLIPCGRCVQCANKRYEMCEHYDYIGSRRDGGFAEYAAVPVWNLIELPDDCAFDKGALFEPLAVALHAVKQAGDLGGRTVVVVGTGMIGIAAACWAKKRGASSVTLIGRSDDKRRMIESIGGLNYLCDAVNRLQADAVIEAVGTPCAVETALEAATPGGQVILMGNPSGDMRLRQDAFWRILRKQLRVCGTWNSSYDGALPSDWTEVAAENTMPWERLITHRFPGDKLYDALHFIRGRREPFFKVMTVWEG